MIIEDNIIRQQVTNRGGGIEISLDSIGYDGEKMSAYQNYLGGGLLGAVTNDCTIENWKADKKLVEVALQLRQYFHALTNPEGSYEEMSFEQNQKMPIAGY